MLGAARLCVAPRRCAVALTVEGLTAPSLDAARIASAGRAAKEKFNARARRAASKSGLLKSRESSGDQLVFVWALPRERLDVNPRRRQWVAA